MRPKIRGMVAEHGSMVWEKQVRAFALLEIVVVLAITALLFGLAVLRIADGGRHQAVEQEGKRLKAIFDLAMQTAILQGREIGAVVGESSYAFVVYQEGQWRAFEDTSVLRRRSLPDGLQIVVAVEGELLAQEQQSGTAGNPQIIFFSNGEISPFQVYLSDRHSSRSFKLTGSLTGVLELSETGSHSGNLSSSSRTTL